MVHPQALPCSQLHSRRASQSPVCSRHTNSVFRTLTTALCQGCQRSGTLNCRSVHHRTAKTHTGCLNPTTSPTTSSNSVTSSITTQSQHPTPHSQQPICQYNRPASFKQDAHNPAAAAAASPAHTPHPAPTPNVSELWRSHPGHPASFRSVSTCPGAQTCTKSICPSREPHLATPCLCISSASGHHSHIHRHRSKQQYIQLHQFG